MSFWCLNIFDSVSYCLIKYPFDDFEHDKIKKPFLQRFIRIYKKMTVCSCYVTYAFQSESTVYSFLNVKKLLARNRRKVWMLSDCNWTRTQNHLVRKGTLNHLANTAKWLSCVLSTYLYGASDCMFLSCHICVSEWIHTL